jgi:hypothetical protein
MPTINEMMPSKFLKKEDAEPPILVTIDHFSKTNVAMENQEPDVKYVMYFAEQDKGLVLNRTNIQLAAQVCGSNNTDDWIGKKVVLYNDPSIGFQGKLVGGIRIRAAKNQPAQAPRKSVDIDAVNRAANDIADMSDDIPF